ncbi:hypothetical protein CERSUDRAFT_99306 [Gelatoporia subvermispora B]|uniref:Uncharacterized protein n=1 Tax=Ceriporiopsis subvermispora (strain B) TaxID=914234 RepID=M2QKC1_CERS8|nr:hypothetical protein CERSUDRAFT_99306 [Gelatoporia subvermispora B]
MPWPDKILRHFQAIPAKPSEADFYGPYSKLLHTMFPPNTDFNVVPKYIPGSRDCTESFVVFEVILDGELVFILQLKAPVRKAFGAIPHTRISEYIMKRSWTDTAWPSLITGDVHDSMAKRTRHTAAQLHDPSDNDSQLPPEYTPDRTSFRATGDYEGLDLVYNAGAYAIHEGSNHVGDTQPSLDYTRFATVGSDHQELGGEADHERIPGIELYQPQDYMGGLQLPFGSYTSPEMNSTTALYGSSGTSPVDVSNLDHLQESGLVVPMDILEDLPPYVTFTNLVAHSATIF